MKKWAWMVVGLNTDLHARRRKSRHLRRAQEEKAVRRARGKQLIRTNACFSRGTCFGDGRSLIWRRRITRSTPTSAPGNAGQYGGVNAPCSLFARYMLSGILEVRPFGKGPLRRFMVYGAPTFLFGKTFPRLFTPGPPMPIGIEHSWGAGIYLNKGFEFRVTQHFLFDRLGSRDKYLGPADLGNNGPWGRYMTVGVRKTFGTRRW